MSKECLTTDLAKHTKCKFHINYMSVHTHLSLLRLQRIHREFIYSLKDLRNHPFITFNFY